MRKYNWLIAVCLVLVLFAALGCGCGGGGTPKATPEPEHVTLIKVVGIDVNGQESEIYDPADPEATFPPENIISGYYGTPEPGTTARPNRTAGPAATPKSTDSTWIGGDGDDWDIGDSTVVNGDDLF
ncbi:MAG: hypothetical protein FWE69_00720 [Clostridiales bacterium]|nr:hypothetical protein [Clostridiales bacterium]